MATVIDGRKVDRTMTKAQLETEIAGATHKALIWDNGEDRRFVLAVTSMDTPASAISKIGSLVTALLPNNYQGVDVDECDTVAVRIATNDETDAMLFSVGYQHLYRHPSLNILPAAHAATTFGDGWVVVLGRID